METHLLIVHNDKINSLYILIRRAKDDFSARHVRTCVRLDVQFRVCTSNFVWRITICWMSLLKDLECFKRLYYSVSRREFKFVLTFDTPFLLAVWYPRLFVSRAHAKLYVKPHVTCARERLKSSLAHLLARSKAFQQHYKSPFQLYLRDLNGENHLRELLHWWVSHSYTEMTAVDTGSLCGRLLSSIEVQIAR